MTSVSDICSINGERGWFFPLAREEANIQRQVRASIYATLMCWCFLGVSIIADIFMSSIEIIANQKRQVVTPSGRIRTEKIWNDTVATLSLMALGSSAPEIFLAVMELIKNEFHFGALGPSTIIGSAAFNLLLIVGVCIMAIPSDQFRRVRGIKTFYVTACFSVIAYMWLAFILVNHTEDVVDISEAVLTLAWFFVLLWVSYCVDIGRCDTFFRRFCGESESSGEEDNTSSVVLSFACEAISFSSTSDEQEVDVVVKVSGRVVNRTVRCDFHTESFTATPGYDYRETDGTLEFSEGISEQVIKLTILPSMSSRSRKFLVCLENAEGARFDSNSDGGKECSLLTATILSTEPISHIRSCGNSLRFIGRGWLDHVCNELRPESSDEAEGGLCCGLSLYDWIYYVLALPFKLLFTTVPPHDLFGAWICFFLAMMWIAGMSAVLSDLAEIFGCCLEIPEIVTAISFVAVGTSMPDLFASLVAAKKDIWADASIVNVTGSNSVNVFLGLGLPWTMGSLYWGIVGRTHDWEVKYPAMANNIDGVAFVVDSTNLGFSVIAFMSACIAALFVLWVRRQVIGGELGGNFVAKVATAATFLLYWLGFVVVVSWRALRWGKFDTTEAVFVLGTAMVFELLVSFSVLFILARLYRAQRNSKQLETSARPSTERNTEIGHSSASPRAKEEEPEVEPIVTIRSEEVLNVLPDGEHKGCNMQSPSPSARSQETVDNETRIYINSKLRLGASLGQNHKIW